MIDWSFSSLIFKVGTAQQSVLASTTDQLGTMVSAHIYIVNNTFFSDQSSSSNKLKFITFVNNLYRATPIAFTLFIPIYYDDALGNENRVVFL